MIHRNKISLVLLGCCLLICSSLLEAQKQDYVWMLGMNRGAEPGIQAYHFDFNIVPFDPIPSTNAFAFGGKNASICDIEGNLQFYTNGCAVANRDHEVMVNGDSINAGNFFDLFWDDCTTFGYPGFQNTLILKDPANSTGYYIIHKPRIYDLEIHNRVFLRDLLYTYVDMALDEGRGAVTQKNQVFHSDLMIPSSYLVAISNANGKDWWILQPVRDTNLMYTFLLDDFGIQQFPSQELEVKFHDLSGATGTSSFSPDGKKYAYFSKYHQLLIFDFDRQSGTLSNMKTIVVRDLDPADIIWSSIEWSPNSRFIYVATDLYLHQVDILADPLQDGVEFIDEYDGTRDPFSTRLFLMAQAPDCRIYMCPTSSTNSYHVINYPDRKGKACHFVQNGVRLPRTSGVASFPNFPRWRVDEEDKCDSSIVSMLGEPVHYVRKMQVWPNPASYELYLDTPEDVPGDVYIMDMQGRPLLRQKVDQVSSGRPIDISGLPTGGYIVEFYPSNPAERLIWSGKVVVQR